MRDFPFSECPTASDLRAFLERDGGSSSSTVDAKIREHLETCQDCSRARADAEPFVDSKGRVSRTLSAATRDALDSQRSAMAAMLTRANSQPEVGQIWTTKRTWSSSDSPSNPLLAMLVVVLRAFSRSFTSGLVIDVAPVTEDLNLAADWSLIFMPEASGINAPVVAHLDFQVTTSIDILGRCIGKLSSRATDSLQQALEAYDAGIYGITPGECGTFGHEAVRNRPEWRLLQIEFEQLVEDFADHLPQETDAEFAHNLEEALESYSPHEVLPRAPTCRPTNKWGEGSTRLGGLPAGGVRSHERAAFEQGSRAELSSPLWCNYAVEWRELVDAIATNYDYSGNRVFVSSNRDQLELYRKRLTLTCAPFGETTSGDTLGTAIVNLILTETSNLSAFAYGGAPPVAEELQLVEKLPLNEVLKWHDWRDRIQSTAGRHFAMSTLVLIDKSLKRADVANLRGAQLSSKAARPQKPH